MDLLCSRTIPSAKPQILILSASQKVHLARLEEENIIGTLVAQARTTRSIIDIRIADPPKQDLKHTKGNLISPQIPYR